MRIRKKRNKEIRTKQQIESAKVVVLETNYMNIMDSLNELSVSLGKIDRKLDAHRESSREFSSHMTKEE